MWKFSVRLVGIKEDCARPYSEAIRVDNRARLVLCAEVFK